MRFACSWLSYRGTKYSIYSFVSFFFWLLTTHLFLLQFGRSQVCNEWVLFVYFSSLNIIWDLCMFHLSSFLLAGIPPRVHCTRDGRLGLPLPAVVSSCEHSQRGTWWTNSAEYSAAIKKDWTADTCNNLELLQDKYAEWKEPDRREYMIWYMSPPIVRSGKCKLTHSDNSSSLRLGVGWGAAVVGTFTISIVPVVLRVSELPPRTPETSAGYYMLLISQ